jgi:adenine-specific DNA-methyltransferase
MPIERLRPSFTFSEDRLAELRAVVPEAFADGKINWDTLREALGDHLEDENQEHFGLFWPSKREARRLAAMPSKGTLVPQPGQGIDEDRTHNIFIEGDNLEVLKLMQKSYANRIKMIYIDPPYNTGNDFVYTDDYSEPLESYLRRTNQMDDAARLLTTNTRASGRFHSNWLSMIYPRLLLSRQLLQQDGVIFVSIDDHEVHHLRLLMNEIFGEENFIVCIVWRRRQVPDNRNLNNVSIDHEYILAYGKGEPVFVGKEKDLSKYSNPDNDPRGSWMSDNLTGLANEQERPNLHYDLVNPETGLSYPPHQSRGWIYERKTMQKLIEEQRILWPASPDGRPRLKRFLNEIRSQFTGYSSLQDFGYTTDGTREIFNLFGEKVIAFPKPVNLVKELCKQGTSSNDSDIILDFFAGSSTTAQAVLELNREDFGNRSFIMVQLPEPTGNPQFSTIADLGRERIRRFIMKVNSEDKGKFGLSTDFDMGIRCFQLCGTNFNEWIPYSGKDISQLEIRLHQAETPLMDNWKPENLLTEILLLQGFPLDSNVSHISGFPHNHVQEVASNFFQHRLYICLDGQIQPETIDALRLRPEDVFVCLDIALSNEAKITLADRVNLKVI